MEKENILPDEYQNLITTKKSQLLYYFMSGIKKRLKKKRLWVYIRNKIEEFKPILRSVTSKPTLVRRFISIENYQKLYPGKVTFLSENEVSLSYCGPKFFGANFNMEVSKVGGFKKYVAELYNVKVIGASNVIVPDRSYVLYDLKFVIENKNIEFSDEGLIWSNKRFGLIGGQFSHQNINEGILMSGNYSFNYYHFFYEIIAKFEALSTSKPDRNIPLLIDQDCLFIPQYAELLSFFNTENRQIIILKKKVLYTVKKLVHISCPNLIAPNFRDISKIESADTLFYLPSLDFLRRQALHHTTPVENLKRIFISRKNASGRRKYNEDEVVNCLEQFGFTIVFPEDHTIREQISFFNNAECIVGATGAAFTNLLFCDKKCKVICLTNYFIDLSIFSTIAAFVGFEMLYLFDKHLSLKSNSNMQSAFTVDIQELRKAVSLKLNSAR